MASLRLPLRPSSFSLHSRQLQHRLTSARNASSAPPKPRLLEKPERFNPPSHGARLKTNKPKHYGPALTQAQKDVMSKKKYPNMFPPEGSFMFWFLTNRSIHMFISLGVLVSLIAGIKLQDFWKDSPHNDLLPPNSMFFAHPWQYLKQYWAVYEMQVMHNTEKIRAERKAKSDDVQKRSEYRKAHGLDDGEKAGLFGGWTAKTDRELLGPAIQNDDNSPIARDSTAALDPSAMLNAGEVQPRKKVLGIW